MAKSISHWYSTKNRKTVRSSKNKDQPRRFFKTKLIYSSFWCKNLPSASKTFTGTLSSWRSMSFGTVSGLDSTCPFCLLETTRSSISSLRSSINSPTNKQQLHWITPISPAGLRYLFPCKGTQLAFRWMFEPEKAEKTNCVFERPMFTQTIKK